MKKGFTLIELLAVIAVLAIIAVIAIPVITNVIEKARSSALKDSAYGLIEAANLYYATSITKSDDFDETTFNLVDGKLKSGSKELSYKGQSFKGSSYVAINEVGSVKLMITDGKYYASKEYDEVNITMSDSQDDALTREELTTKLNEANEKITSLETQVNENKNNITTLTTKSNAIGKTVGGKKKSNVSISDGVEVEIASITLPSKGLWAISVDVWDLSDIIVTKGFGYAIAITGPDMGNGASMRTGKICDQSHTNMYIVYKATSDNVVLPLLFTTWGNSVNSDNIGVYNFIAFKLS